MVVLPIAVAVLTLTPALVVGAADLMTKREGKSAQDVTTRAQMVETVPGL